MLFRSLYAEGALSAVGAGEEVVPVSEYRGLQSQVRELQRLLGKKTLENEILREALDYRSPREFRRHFVESTTENAVGARRRPHGSTMSADAIGSSPPAAPSAETRSVWLDASVAVDQP